MEHDESSKTQKEHKIQEYSGVFTGIGQRPGACYILLYPEVEPSVHASRKIPVALEEKVKHALDKM